jgi:hypothetical protein
VRLFGRSYKLVLDTVEIVGGQAGDGSRIGLDIAFKVEKSIDATPPNKATIQVWNLNPDHRRDFERRFGSEIEKSKRKTIRVELSVGYGDDMGVIFRGDLRNLVNKQDGAVDWVTEVSGADGGHSFKTSRVSRSFGPGVEAYTVARACVQAMGVGEGNLSDWSAQFSIGTLGATFPEGAVLSGSAEREFDRIARAAGFTWSIQHGVLQLAKRGEPIRSQVYELGPDTGLVGSPFAEVDATVIPGKTASKEAAKRAGLVNVKTLMLHTLAPGQKVALKSDQFKGGYQINSITFIGNTATNDWNCEMKVKAY